MKRTNIRIKTSRVNNLGTRVIYLVDCRAVERTIQGRGIWCVIRPWQGWEWGVLLKKSQPMTQEKAKTMDIEAIQKQYHRLWFIL